VTWQHDWASAQRLLARSWFRDGDVFAQLVQGNVSNIDHGTTIPLSLEMIEADLVPFEYSLPPTSSRASSSMRGGARPASGC
jgi:capsid protein